MKNFIIFLLFILLSSSLIAETIFFDDFESGLGNWNSIINSGTGEWLIYSSPFPNTYTMPPESTGNVCAAVADEAGSGSSTDCSLQISTALDLSIHTDIFLEFDSDFRTFDSEDYCYVDVSANGGSSWVNILTWGGDNVDVAATHEIIDITSIATGSSNVLVRFHSVQPGWDWWWAIDNVHITAEVDVVYDNDLMANGFTGPISVNAGTSQNYEVTIMNRGTVAQTTYTVQLLKNGSQILTSIEVNTTINPEESVVQQLVWIIPADENEGIIDLSARVVLETDENPNNNTSNEIEVTIFPQGVIGVDVGNGITTNERYPVCFSYRNSLTQSLYFSDEIDFTGLITKIAYYNHFSENITKQTKIWMGETTQDSLTGGWIQATELNLVFDGAVSFLTGDNRVNIELNSPYDYSGQNLVIMVNRPMDESTYSAENQFYITETLEHTDRTIYDRDNVVEFDPLNPPEIFYGNEDLPNITFYFLTANLGSIEGYVNNEDGDPLVNAEVRREDSDQMTFTNDEGYFLMSNIPENTHNFTASYSGYDSLTLEAEIIENETTELSYILQASASANVQGFVAGSDNAEIGLENATVIFTGLYNYNTTTNSDGIFNIPGVYLNLNYNISISHNDYQNYNEDIFITQENVDLGTLLLSEFTMPPGNVQAEQNEQETEVALFWNSPGVGANEFRYDDGEHVFQIGFGALQNAVFGAVHQNVAVIESINWFLTSVNGSHNSVKLFIFGLNDDGLPDASQLLFQSGTVPNNDDEWNSYELPETVNCPDGFLIGVNTPGVYTGLALDDGIGTPWEFEMETQFAISDWTNATESWLDIGSESAFRKNLMIRAWGVDLGSPSLRLSKIETSQKDSRSFMGYNIYRFDSNDIQEPENWDLIESAHPDTNYIDTSWASLSIGEYQFAIKSLYTNNVESVPAFSNVIYKSTTDSPQNSIPLITKLNQNYPNPFNPETTISFSLDNENSGLVEISIFNLKGQKIRTLLRENLNAENYSLIWNGKDRDDKQVSSGVYFYKLTTHKVVDIRKMLMIK